MVDYTIVIGLEVHTELSTETKIFCGCTTKFGGEVNTHVCPVCLGLPGVLPRLNKRVVEYAMRTALALNAEISEYSKFDRKNYYYPDLPKAFQISQNYMPIARGGWLEIVFDGKPKRISLDNIHMEEEAGKSIHDSETIVGSQYSLEDYNRTGVPLLEIVSNPDLRSPEEAIEYLQAMKSILEYIEVSDCKMQEGSFRCDANISIMPVGSTVLGKRVEMKNMNSFRAIQRALEYEAKRQAEVLSAGGVVLQESRAWDDRRGVTVSMRSKEEAHDYRYFPEPDLMPIVISADWITEVRSGLPELPASRRARFESAYGLPEYDAGMLTYSKAMSDWFEQAVSSYGGDAKVVSNWMLGELSRLLNATGKELGEILVTPVMLSDMLLLIDKGTISGKIAKAVMEEMFTTGKAAEVIVKEKGLVQMSDTAEIGLVIDKVLADNPKSVADYMAGKDRAVGFLVGQVMKATQGRANPGMLNDMLKEKLEALRG